MNNLVGNVSESASKRYEFDYHRKIICVIVALLKRPYPETGYVLFCVRHREIGDEFGTDHTVISKRYYSCGLASPDFNPIEHVWNELQVRISALQVQPRSTRRVEHHPTNRPRKPNMEQVDFEPTYDPAPTRGNCLDHVFF